jgi:AcrR family transcriptional regulator
MSDKDKLIEAIFERHREVRDRMLAAHEKAPTPGVTGEALWHGATGEVLTQVFVALYGAMRAGDSSMTFRQLVEIAMGEAEERIDACKPRPR